MKNKGYMFILTLSTFLTFFAVIPGSVTHMYSSGMSIQEVYSSILTEDFKISLNHIKDYLYNLAFSYRLTIIFYVCLRQICVIIQKELEKYALEIASPAISQSNKHLSADDQFRPEYLLEAISIGKISSTSCCSEFFDICLTCRPDQCHCLKDKIAELIIKYVEAVETQIGNRV